MRINLILLLFATSIIPLMIGINVLSKEDKLGSKNWYFFMICISGSAWNFGYLILEMACDASDINFGRSLTLAGSFATSCLIIKFISILIEGNSEKKSKITISATFLALIIFPLASSMDNIVIIKTSYGASYYLKQNLITRISAIYGILTILVSLIITLKWVKVSKYRRDKLQGKVILGGILFSILGLLNGYFKLLNGEMKIPSCIYIFFLIVIIYYFSRKYNALSITVSNLAEYIYSSANMPILVLNDNKKIELANSSAVDFFNRNSEKLIGRYITDIFTYEKEDIHMFEINKGGNLNNEHKFDSTCLLNNAKCSISTTSIYDKYNQFICAIFVITDLTDKMNLIEELNESKEEAVSANLAKSAFLANMSHEIRTPMNAIIGMSEIILQRDIPNEIKDNVISIRNSGKGLLTIINDILDLSKIESGKFEVVNDNYMIPSVVTDIVNIISIRLEEKPIELIVNVDPNIPNDLIGDEIRIKQILINILGNAVKFTKEGFIKLIIEWEKVQEDFYLIIKVEDSGIGIKKEDIKKLFKSFNQVDTRKNREIQGTGLGLSISKNLANLMGGDIVLESEYEKGTTFTITAKQQVEDYRKMAEIVNGNEIHLVFYEEAEIMKDSFTYTLDKLNINYVICDNDADFDVEISKMTVTHIFAKKHLLERIDKIISQYNINPEIVVLLNINDTPDFTRKLKAVYLPLFCIQIADILNNETTEFQCKKTGIDTTQIIPMPYAKILIVDDNAVNLQVATGLMNPYEMEMECASSGQEAIDKIKETKYDLVFMDHMMPGLDGVDTTKIIRNLEGKYYTEVPIVALTANALSEARKMFLSEGFNDFLAKPIELSKLNLILKKWVLAPHIEIINTVEENTVAIKPEFQDNKTRVEKEEIEGIKLEVGVSNVGGNIDLYISILETYYKETKSKIKELYETIKNNDIKLFTTHVHGIKSSSASIGAKEVSDLAKELEFAGKEKKLEYINSNIDEFTVKTLKLLENIDTFMEKRGYKSVDDLVEDVKENEKDIYNDEKVIASIDKEILERLREAFNDVDMEEIESLLKEIKIQDYDEKTTNLIKQLQENLQMFEYDAAIELISEFL